MPKTVYFPGLFKQGKIGNLRIKNRIVQLPTGGNFTGPNCEVTDRTIAYYAERAKGGIGLIIVGGARVLPIRRPIDKRFLNLCEKKLFSGHFYLVEAVQSYGAKITIQLTHPGSQVFLADWGGEQPPSPSGVQQFNVKGLPYAPPRQMSKSEIYHLIEKFVQAALNAKRIGYDMVEIHAGHGHLLGAFMSPATNKRTDEFGGSIKNRIRFVSEIIKQIHQVAGDGFPISVRISADEFIPEGITTKDSPEIAKVLEEAGAACINISCGTYRNQHKVSDVMRMEEGWKIPMWRAIKRAVTIPTIAGGGNRNPEFCERLIIDDEADFVGLARQMQADPYWPKKTAEGRIEDLNRCISCMRCLYGLDGQPQIVRQCTVNPMWGREVDFINARPPSNIKKVLVIGGGPGGMEAARITSLRGHETFLYEKRHELGGQLLISSVAPGKNKITWFRDYLKTQIDKQKVKIKLGVKVDSDIISKIKPDVIILASGALPGEFNIIGTSDKNALTAWDVLSGKFELNTENAVIIGGGIVGCEVAEYLAKQGKKITIIEMLPEIAKSMEPLNRRSLLEELEKYKVTFLLNRKVIEVNDKTIIFVNTMNGERNQLQARQVVLALPAVPEQNLLGILDDMPIETFTIGDCCEPKTLLEAVRGGFLIGYSI